MVCVVQHGHVDAALLEEGAKEVAQVGVVVDQQNLDGRVGHGWALIDEDN
jgi:hypothetical protein